MTGPRAFPKVHILQDCMGTARQAIVFGLNRLSCFFLFFFSFKEHSTKYLIEFILAWKKSFSIFVGKWYMKFLPCLQECSLYVLLFCTWITIIYIVHSGSQLENTI